MSVDNSALVRAFVPKTDDGDTFLYTEMLDRARGKGNNGHRLVKTFYHRSREEFDEQVPVIRQLCDLAKARAYTRLSPRSYRKVGEAFARLVVDAALSHNFAGMKSLYNRACGTAPVLEKRWLFDVDNIISGEELYSWLLSQDNLLARIPSKWGFHLICRPFDRMLIGASSGDGSTKYPGVTLHKDNPTNLYIPDGAA